MITVIVVAENQLFRQRLSDVLNGKRGISAVGTAPEPRRALALIDNLRADVTVVSMSLARPR